jgi:hypothetical protein
MSPTTAGRYAFDALTAVMTENSVFRILRIEVGRTLKSRYYERKALPRENQFHLTKHHSTFPANRYVGRNAVAACEGITTFRACSLQAEPNPFAISRSRSICPQRRSARRHE